MARIYRLFSRINKGLDPVAEAFKRHVEGEGLALVKEVTEAINQKKEAGKPLATVCTQNLFVCNWQSLARFTTSYHCTSS